MEDIQALRSSHLITLLAESGIDHSPELLLCKVVERIVEETVDHRPASHPIEALHLVGDLFVEVESEEVLDDFSMASA